MSPTPDLPPNHWLMRGGLIGAGLLVAVAVAVLFGTSAAPGQLWSGCLTFVDHVRRLW